MEVIALEMTTATRFIGGHVDPEAKALTLVRGDMVSVITPFAMFQPSGDGRRSRIFPGCG